MTTCLFYQSIRHTLTLYIILTLYVAPILLLLPEYKVVLYYIFSTSQQCVCHVCKYIVKRKLYYTKILCGKTTTY